MRQIFHIGNDYHVIYPTEYCDKYPNLLHLYMICTRINSYQILIVIHFQMNLKLILFSLSIDKLSHLPELFRF